MSPAVEFLVIFGVPFATIALLMCATELSTIKSVLFSIRDELRKRNEKNP